MNDLLQEIQEIRLQVAENRLILGALLKHWPRPPDAPAPTPQKPGFNAKDAALLRGLVAIREDSASAREEAQ